MQPQPEYIPLAVPDLGEEEIAEVAAALRSGWITSGPRTAHFEREFCEYTAAPHALAVNSCTSGLHLALVALGIGPGDDPLVEANRTNRFRVVHDSHLSTLAQ